MFVLFFPQLIAGPIVRHNEIIHQFDRSPRGPEMWQMLSRGGILFLIGFAFASVMGLVRMAQGGHFLSDVVFAMLLTWLVAWLVHSLVFRWILPTGSSGTRDMRHGASAS